MYYLWGGRPYYYEEWEKEFREIEEKAKKEVSEWIIASYEKKKKERAERRNRRRF